MLADKCSDMRCIKNQMLMQYVMFLEIAVLNGAGGHLMNVQLCDFYNLASL